MKGEDTEFDRLTRRRRELQRLQNVDDDSVQRTGFFTGPLQAPQPGLQAPASGVVNALVLNLANDDEDEEVWPRTGRFRRAQRARSPVPPNPLRALPVRAMGPLDKHQLRRTAYMQEPAPKADPDVIVIDDDDDDDGQQLERRLEAPPPVARAPAGFSSRRSHAARSQAAAENGGTRSASAAPGAAARLAPAAAGTKRPNGSDGGASPPGGRARYEAGGTAAGFGPAGGQRWGSGQDPRLDAQAAAAARAGPSAAAVGQNGGAVKTEWATADAGKKPDGATGAAAVALGPGNAAASARTGGDASRSAVTAVGGPGQAGAAGSAAGGPAPGEADARAEATATAAAAAATAAGAAGAAAGGTAGDEQPPPQPPQQLTCGICLDEHPAQSFHVIDACRHQYCRDCLRQHVQLAARERVYPVRCPQPDCRGPGVSVAEGLELLDSADDRERLQMMEVESSLPQNLRFYCPNPACSLLMLLEEEEPPENAPVRCHGCRRQLCARCRVMWHAGLSCAQHRALQTQPGSAGGEEAALLGVADERGWKPCPQCRNLVELAHGCNHITCKCGAEWCYKCGAPWRRMQPPGSPAGVGGLLRGRSVPTCNCRLWDDNNRRLEQEFRARWYARRGLPVDAARRRAVDELVGLGILQRQNQAVQNNQNQAVAADVAAALAHGAGRQEPAAAAEAGPAAAAAADAAAGHGLWRMWMAPDPMREALEFDEAVLLAGGPPLQANNRGPERNADGGGGAPVIAMAAPPLPPGGALRLIPLELLPAGGGEAAVGRRGPAGPEADRTPPPLPLGLGGPGLGPAGRRMSRVQLRLQARQEMRALMVALRGNRARGGAAGQQAGGGAAGAAGAGAGADAEAGGTGRGGVWDPLPETVAAAAAAAAAAPAAAAWAAAEPAPPQAGRAADPPYGRQSSWLDGRGHLWRVVGRENPGVMRDDLFVRMEPLDVGAGTPANPRGPYRRDQGTVARVAAALAAAVDELSDEDAGARPGRRVVLARRQPQSMAPFAEKLDEEQKEEEGEEEKGEGEEREEEESGSRARVKGGAVGPGAVAPMAAPPPRRQPESAAPLLGGVRRGSGPRTEQGPSPGPQQRGAPQPQPQPRRVSLYTGPEPRARAEVPPGLNEVRQRQQARRTAEPEAAAVTGAEGARAKEGDLQDINMDAREEGAAAGEVRRRRLTPTRAWPRLCGVRFDDKDGGGDAGDTGGGSRAAGDGNRRDGVGSEAETPRGGGGDDDDDDRKCTSAHRLGRRTGGSSHSDSDDTAIRLRGGIPLRLRSGRGSGWKGDIPTPMRRRFHTGRAGEPAADGVVVPARTAAPAAAAGVAAQGAAGAAAGMAGDQPETATAGAIPATGAAAGSDGGSRRPSPPPRKPPPPPPLRPPPPRAEEKQSGSGSSSSSESEDELARGRTAEGRDLGIAASTVAAASVAPAAAPAAAAAAAPDAGADAAAAAAAETVGTAAAVMAQKLHSPEHWAWVALRARGRAQAIAAAAARAAMPLAERREKWAGGEGEGPKTGVAGAATNAAAAKGAPSEALAAEAAAPAPYQFPAVHNIFPHLMLPPVELQPLPGFAAFAAQPQGGPGTDEGAGAAAGRAKDAASEQLMNLICQILGAPNRAGQGAPAAAVVQAMATAPPAEPPAGRRLPGGGPAGQGEGLAGGAAPQRPDPSPGRADTAASAAAAAAAATIPAAAAAAAGDGGSPAALQMHRTEGEGHGAVDRTPDPQSGGSPLSSQRKRRTKVMTKRTSEQGRAAEVDVRLGGAGADSRQASTEPAAGGAAPAEPVSKAAAGGGLMPPPPPRVLWPGGGPRGARWDEGAKERAAGAVAGAGSAAGAAGAAGAAAAGGLAGAKPGAAPASDLDSRRRALQSRRPPPRFPLRYASDAPRDLLESSMRVRICTDPVPDPVQDPHPESYDGDKAPAWQQPDMQPPQRRRRLLPGAGSGIDGVNDAERPTRWPERPPRRAKPGEDAEAQRGRCDGRAGGSAAVAAAAAPRPDGAAQPGPADASATRGTTGAGSPALERGQQPLLLPLPPPPDAAAGQVGAAATPFGLPVNSVQVLPVEVRCNEGSAAARAAAAAAAAEAATAAAADAGGGGGGGPGQLPIVLQVVVQVLHQGGDPLPQDTLDQIRHQVDRVLAMLRPQIVEQQTHRQAD